MPDASSNSTTAPRSEWRHRLHEIIFEADTRAGRAFDIALLVGIILSVITVALESVPEIRVRYGPQLRVLEWVFTILFTIEYVVRLLCVTHPWKYALSFFGIIDLLAILPTYLSLVVAGSQSLLVIRALRLLRVFRVFKLAHFVGEANLLRTAIRRASRKIIVFQGTVLMLVLILGSVMYLVEGEAHGFDSIPHGVYWAIVTLTTVGYGDITPDTLLGRIVASLVMITGYAIIAVPTGIMTVEMAHAFRRPITTQACPHCSLEGHEPDAKFCKHCGESLENA